MTLSDFSFYVLTLFMGEWAPIRNAGRTTWPVALKNIPHPPIIATRPLSYAYGIGSDSSKTKRGVALYVSELHAVPVAPLEPPLVWVDPDTGRTKVRDHPKPVGSCASAAMGRIPYSDLYDTIMMLRDVIPMPRPHPSGCGSFVLAACLSTSTICDWQSIGVRRYDPDRHARVPDLLCYLAGWALCTCDLYGSVFLLRAWLRSSRRDSASM